MPRLILSELTVMTEDCIRHAQKLLSRRIRAIVTRSEARKRSEIPQGVTKASPLPAGNHGHG